MTKRKHTLEERVQAVREHLEDEKSYSELSAQYGTTAQVDTRFPERSLYFSAMAMALPWPDRYSSTAFCRISSLYVRLWAFPEELPLVLQRIKAGDTLGQNDMLPKRQTGK